MNKLKFQAEAITLNKRKNAETTQKLYRINNKQSEFVFLRIYILYVLPITEFQG